VPSDDPADLCRHANLADQSFRRRGYPGDSVSCDDGHAATASVGRYAANALGLHDMHGNVWEWVEDCSHDESYKGAPDDGSAWIEGGECGNRVVRGGSWRDGPQFLRSANRNWSSADLRVNFLGFRVARTLTAGAGAIMVAPGAH